MVLGYSERDPAKLKLQVLASTNPGVWFAARSPRFEPSNLADLVHHGKSNQMMKQSIELCCGLPTHATTLLPASPTWYITLGGHRVAITPNQKSHTVYPIFLHSIASSLVVPKSTTVCTRFLGWRRKRESMTEGLQTQLPTMNCWATRSMLPTRKLCIMVL